MESPQVRLACCGRAAGSGRNGVRMDTDPGVPAATAGNHAHGDEAGGDPAGSVLGRGRSEPAGAAEPQAPGCRCRVCSVIGRPNR